MIHWTFTVQWTKVALGVRGRMVIWGDLGTL